jgi:catechol 2,3-dioxygenase-like lactoylglutathione lyase family enzyme
VLDHVGVPVSDFERSKRFYAQALSPLGYELIMEPSDSAAGFGRSGKPDFWIAQGEPGQAFHIAFAADDRATVDAFHEAAIAAGGRDNGGPGRPRSGRQQHRSGLPCPRRRSLSRRTLIHRTS